MSNILYKSREQESLERFIHRMLIHVKNSNKILTVNYQGTIFILNNKDTTDTAQIKYWKKRSF